MVVSINFLGIQRAVTRTRGIDMPINGDTTASAALDYVRQQYPELPLAEDRVLITVNHEMASPDRLLEPNDAVSFVPHIGGG